MGMDLVSLKASKKYVDETVLGGGAVVGKNVTVSSITPIEGGNRVIFSYTLDDGTPKTSTMDVKNGADGQNGNDGVDGLDGISPTIAENPGNTSKIYKFDITTSDEHSRLQILKERMVKVVVVEKKTRLNLSQLMA